MLTKVLALVLVVLIGLALGIETARYVHAHATGVDASGVVNIHHALGFGLLATSGALLLSLRWTGAWLSRDPKFVMDGWRLYRLGRDAHETEEAALRRSKEMIAAKLKSIDKQRDQIQKLAEKLQ